MGPFIAVFLSFLMALLGGPLALSAQGTLNSGKNAIKYEQSIHVDTTAESAQEAKVEALQLGEIRAAKQLSAFLLRALIADNPQLLEAKVTPKSLQMLVSDYEILAEKTSNNRYIATIKYRFEAAPLEKVLLEAGARFVTPPAKKLLVLPVLLEKTPAETKAPQESFILWGETPWREAWEKEEKNNHYISFTLPLGDVQDIMTLSAAEAIEGLYPAFIKMQHRYQADLSTLVALAMPVYDQASIEQGPALEAQHPVALKVYMLHGLQPTGEVIPNFTLQAKVGDTAQSLYTQGVQEALKIAADQWKYNHDELSNKTVSLAQSVIHIPLRKPFLWFDWQKKLSDLCGKTNLVSFEPGLISSKQAVVKFSHYGPLKSLQSQFAKRRFNLLEHDGLTYLYDDLK